MSSTSSSPSASPVSALELKESILKKIDIIFKQGIDGESKKLDLIFDDSSNIMICNWRWFAFYSGLKDIKNDINDGLSATFETLQKLNSILDSIVDLDYGLTFPVFSSETEAAAYFNDLRTQMITIKKDFSQGMVVTKSKINIFEVFF